MFLYEVVVNRNFIQQFAHEKKYSKGEFTKIVEKCSKGIDLKEGDLALTKITNIMVEDLGFRDKGPFWELKVRHIVEIDEPPESSPVVKALKDRIAAIIDRPIPNDVDECYMELGKLHAEQGMYMVPPEYDLPPEHRKHNQLLATIRMLGNEW